MTATIIRFPRKPKDPPADIGEQVARDIKASMDSLDDDIREFAATARRVRRLLMLRATAKKRLEQQERFLAFEKQLRSRRDTKLNDIFAMFKKNPA